MVGVSAEDDQNFYECKVQTEAVKLNPGPGEETVKDITVVFDHEAEHTLVCNTWLQGMWLEVYPIEPVMVTMPVGKKVETRQIAILPLVGASKGGEPVVLAARIVDCALWSKVSALAIDRLRERFVRRPRIPKNDSRQQEGPVHLLVGKDYRGVFPKVLQEENVRGDELFLTSILFKPGQLVCAAASKDISWLPPLPKVRKNRKWRTALGGAGVQPETMGSDRRSSAASSLG